MVRFKFIIPFLGALALGAGPASAGGVTSDTDFRGVTGIHVTASPMSVESVDCNIDGSLLTHDLERQFSGDGLAVNQSPDITDRLVSITSDIGTVTVDGDARLPAGGMLFIGKPDGQNVAPGPLQSNNAVKATVALAKPISNGLTYDFTFNFEKAGQASVLVPISAGLGPQQV